MCLADRSYNRFNFILFSSISSSTFSSIAFVKLDSRLLLISFSILVICSSIFSEFLKINKSVNICNLGLSSSIYFKIFMALFESKIKYHDSILLIDFLLKIFESKLLKLFLFLSTHLLMNLSASGNLNFNNFSGLLFCIRAIHEPNSLWTFSYNSFSLSNFLYRSPYGEKINQKCLRLLIVQYQSADKCFCIAFFALLIILWNIDDFPVWCFISK